MVLARAALLRPSDNSACKRKACMRAHGFPMFVAIVVISLFLPAINGDGLPLTLGEVYKGNITKNTTQYWRLPSTTLENDDSCSPSQGRPYLSFEFWRLNLTGVVDVRAARLLFFLASRGAQPSAYMTLDQRTGFRPAMVPLPQLGTAGTYGDWDGYQNGRPLQRFLVPLNASFQEVDPNWYVTIANLDTTSMGYALRVTCISDQQQAPCPRPPYTPPIADGSTASDTAQQPPEECGGSARGICGNPMQGFLDDRLNPALNRICYCQPGWGDVDCATRAPRLANGGLSSAALAPGDWAYWTVSVPVPASKADAAASPGGGSPALLIEMNRGGGGFGTAEELYGGGVYGGGGDPVLFLVPKYPADAGRVPFLSEFPKFADYDSVRLYQNLHFHLVRDFAGLVTLPATPPASGGNATVVIGGGGGGGRTLEFYVAVYNNPQSGRFPAGSKLAVARANVTVRARWQTTAEPSPLCPGDCYLRGRCTDPYNLSATAYPVLVPGPIPPTANFLCTCDKGFGGPLCEGSLRNLSLSAWADGGSDSLAPGQWAFFVVPFDPGRFNTAPGGDDLLLQWFVRDAAAADGGSGSTVPPSAYYNALLTTNLMAFPRLPLVSIPDLLDTFMRGMLVTYDRLFEDDGQWKPMRFSGQRFRSGYTYVFGLYNSDYLRQAPYNYTLSMSVPAARRTWLHPYMSVVLGVTAAIILCLLMTLLRRLLQRYGWGPFRPRGPDGMGGTDGGSNPSRVQVAQMPPRHRGVPPAIIDAFYSYPYRATRAEKAQLAKSRPDPQPQPPPAQQQQTHTRQQQKQASEAVGAAPPLMAATGNAVELAKLGDGSGDGGVGVNQLLVPGVAAASGHIVPAAPAAAPVPLAPAASCSGVGDDDCDEPQCAVCLCEYEEGEAITQLPCKHEFHGTCIRKWLQTHYTCPICRVSLLPNQPDSPDPVAEARPAAVVAGTPPADPQQLQQQQQQSSTDNPRGGSGGGGAVVVPMFGPPAGPAVEAAPAGAAPVGGETAAAARPGLLARLVDGLRGASRLGVSQQPVEPLQPRLQSWAAAPMAVAADGSSPHLAAAPTEPRPAALVGPTSPALRGGAGSSSRRGGVFVSAPPPGSPQLLARGPTASLDSPARQRTSRGSGGATPPVAVLGPTGTASPRGLAAGRQSSGAALPVPLGADAVASGGGGGDAGDAGPSGGTRIWGGAAAAAAGPRTRNPAALELPPQMMGQVPSLEPTTQVSFPARQP